MESIKSLEGNKHTYLYNENEKILGEGAYGKVVKANIKEDGTLVAIKFMEQSQFKQNGLGNVLDRLFQNETKYVTKINSPHVIKIIEYFADKQYRYQVLEYINGENLEEFFNKQPDFRLEEAKVIGIMKQILKGFQAMHEQLIIHRDLKLENIMYHNPKEGEPIIKIVDFGFCTALKKPENITKTILGNDSTQAPEVYKGNYGMSADLYGLGCLLYEMLYGQVLFDSEEDKHYKDIEFEQSVNVSQEMKDLILRMTKYKVDERITFQELYAQSIFKEQMISKIYQEEVPNTKFNVQRDPVVQQYAVVKYMHDSITNVNLTFTQNIDKQIQNEAYYLIYKVICDNARTLLVQLEKETESEKQNIVEEIEKLENDLISQSSAVKQPLKIQKRENKVPQNTLLCKEEFQNEMKDYNIIYNKEVFNKLYVESTKTYFRQLKEQKDLYDNPDYLQHVLKIKNCIDQEELLKFEFGHYVKQWHSGKVKIQEVKAEISD